MNTISNIRVRSHVLINPWSSWKHTFFSIWSVKRNLFFAPKFAFFWRPSDSSMIIRHGTLDVRTVRRGLRLFTWLNTWLKNFNLGINERLFSFAKSDPLQKPVAENDQFQIGRLSIKGSSYLDNLFRNYRARLESRAHMIIRWPVEYFDDTKDLRVPECWKYLF